MSLLRECFSDAVSLEEAAGLTREIEYVIYAELKDVTELLKATSIERQFQWCIYTQNDVNQGLIRVRCTNDTEYTQTTKVKVSGDTAAGKDENCISIDANQFKMFSMLSKTGMYKDRYIFPIPDTDLKWEVDCFIQSDGSYAPWCKIDLELPDPQAIDFKSLPYPITLGEVLQQNQSDRLDTIYAEHITVVPGKTTKDFNTKPIAELQAQLTTSQT